jgi:Ca2+-binding EF-hand superfamily protein
MLTDAIVKHLDENNDSIVNEPEWKQAAATIGKLDTNDDELIGPGELVSKTSYPGALGSFLMKAYAADVKTDPIGDLLPFVLLRPGEGDSELLLDSDESRQSTRSRLVSPEAFATMRTSTSSTAWQIRLNTIQDGRATLAADGHEPTANGRLTFTTVDVRFDLRVDDGKLLSQVAAARRRSRALFAECDANSDENLDENELGTAKAGEFKELIGIADRDGDGKTSQAEFTTLLDLVEHIAAGHVLLTIIDHGTGLFELLDADHDGGLSVRELRDSWNRLQTANCVTHDSFDRTTLPRQLLGAVSHGHPLTTIGKPIRHGPEWFKAMDRNGDGDLSTREFIGPAALFEKMDTDQDGLIDEMEANR